MPTVAPPQLVKKAAQLDKQLRECWSSIKWSRRIFGEIVNQIRKEELHKYIAKPGSRKGYPSWWEYVDAVTDGEIKRSTAFINMGIASLTEGENALPAETVDALPSGNAYQLSKVPAAKRTPELVKKARTQPHHKFVATVQSLKNESLPPEKQKAPLVEFYRRLHPMVATKLEETIARFRRHPIVKDGLFELTLEEKAIHALCCAADASEKEVLDAAEKRENDACQTVPTETEESTTAEHEADQAPGIPADFNADKAAELIAAATTERRVVPIKGEAIH
jgi:hypothetical protein